MSTLVILGSVSRITRGSKFNDNNADGLPKRVDMADPLQRSNFTGPIAGSKLIG